MFAPTRPLGIRDKVWEEGGSVSLPMHMFGKSQLCEYAVDPMH